MSECCSFCWAETAARWLSAWHVSSYKYFSPSTLCPMHLPAVGDILLNSRVVGCPFAALQPQYDVPDMWPPDVSYFPPPTTSFQTIFIQKFHIKIQFSGGSSSLNSSQLPSNFIQILLKSKFIFSVHEDKMSQTSQKSSGGHVCSRNGRRLCLVGASGGPSKRQIFQKCPAHPPHLGHEILETK